MTTSQLVNAEAAPFVVGTGLVALDVVLSDAQPGAARHWAGGTCGNVLTILRYLGWRAAPVARLREGDAARALLADFLSWGVETEFVTLATDGSTPVIVQRIGRTRKGEPYHTFSWRCPHCGARLPAYKPVLATDAATVCERLGHPRVFFFDRLSRGALVLARAAAEAGAAVVFEPSSVTNPTLFREAWGLAHVVKYAHERLQDLPADLEVQPGPRIQIETLGHEGLRYRARLGRARPGRWQRLDALPAIRVDDTAGAGDWCSAGIICRLFSNGSVGLGSFTGNDLRDAIRYGQALAAWTCGFEGARGGMYEADRDQFKKDVADILGEYAGLRRGSPTRQVSALSGIARFCPSCDRPAPGRGRIRKAGAQRADE